PCGRGASTGRARSSRRRRARGSARFRRGSSSPPIPTRGPSRARLLVTVSRRVWQGRRMRGMHPSTTPLYETEVHAQLRGQPARFAREEIAPHARAWEEAAEFPRDLYARFAAAGLLGAGYPEAIGGGGGDLSHVLAIQEELVLGGRSVGTVVGLGS